MRRRTVVWYGRFAASFLTGLLTLGSLGRPTFAQDTSGKDTSEKREGESTLDLLGLQDQFEKIADLVSPSVVSVSASEVAGSPDQFPSTDELTPEKLHRELNRGVRTVGTGFVIDPRGYIVTNEHVVGTGQEMWITTDSGRVYPAMVVATDHVTDLAVLKAPVSLPAVHFAADESLHRGMWSIALGNPYGLATEGNMAMAAGVVSAVDRNLAKLSRDEHRQYTGLVQTTAEINPGNSGGPLIDIQGRVIGINVAVILPDKQTNGIGFAIPADAQTLNVIENLKEGHEVIHAFMGVSLATPSQKERHNAGSPPDIGAVVDRIIPGTPAAASTLADGDVVTSFDGQTVRDVEQLSRMIASASVDRPTQLLVFRKGQLVSVPVHAAAQTEFAERPTERFHWDGMLLAPLPANWTQDGVMVLAVDAASHAAQQGVRPGSIVTSVAGRLISNLEQLRQIARLTPADHCPLRTESGERVAAAK